MPIKKIRGIGIPTLKLFSLSAVFNSNNLLHRAPLTIPFHLHRMCFIRHADLFQRIYSFFQLFGSYFIINLSTFVPVRPGCMLRLRPHKTEIPARWSAYGPKHMLLKLLAPQPARSDYPPDPGQAAPLPNYRFYLHLIYRFLLNILHIPVSYPSDTHSPGHSFLINSQEIIFRIANSPARQRFFILCFNKTHQCNTFRRIDITKHFSFNLGIVFLLFLLSSFTQFYHTILPSTPSIIVSICKPFLIFIFLPTCYNLIGSNRKHTTNLMEVFNEKKLTGSLLLSHFYASQPSSPLDLLSVQRLTQVRLLLPSGSMER